MANHKHSMPRGKLKNLVIDELSGVDRPCQQPATAAIMKRSSLVKALFERVLKQAVLTSTDAGHAHSLDLDDPAEEWCDMYSTSCQTTEGAAQPHSHAWTFDPSTGAITIADDSGHSHTVAATIPRDVLAAAVLNEAAEKQRRASRNAQAAAEAVSNGSVAVTVSPVEMRAPAGNSPPTAAANTVNANSQENPMDPKFAKMLATALLLPETQRVHVAKLAPDEQTAFLGMDAAARDAAVKAADAADPEVYKTAGGLSIRKSHGPIAEQMARQADAHATQIAAQAEQLAVSKAAAEQAGFEKRASSELSHFAKALGVRAAIVKAVDGIADETLRKEAHEAIKGANSAMQMLGKANGSDNGGAGPELEDPLVAYNTALAKHAVTIDPKMNPIDATASFLATSEGKAAKAAYDATRAYGRQ